MTMTRDELIESNMKLAGYVANKMIWTNIPREDLVSIGYIGLVQAADAYDDTRGVKFSTFAVKVMQNKILHELRKENRRNALPTISMQTVVSKDFSRDVTLEDTIGVWDEYDNRLEAEEILSLPITERERDMLCSYYGIGTPKLKQQEIADKYGITQPTVARNIQKAIKTIRRELNGRSIDRHE